jgi:hypothetical protein
MNLETVFEFIKERRGYKMPLRFKLLNRLPLTEDELKIKGDLDFYSDNVSLLPDNLTVLGYLDIRNTQVKYLPDNLTVGGTLYASFLYIDSIPDNLRVGGGLFLQGNPLIGKYDSVQIREMIEKKGGYVKGIIYV